MTQLGLKHGALKKGLIQDHERRDVVRVRDGFTKEWMAMEPRMHCWRVVDVVAAKRKLAELDTAAAYTTADELIDILNLVKVKGEKPTDKEEKVMRQWAEAHVSSSARILLQNTTKRKLVIHADQFAEALDDDGILGPLCTKDGVYAKWVKEGAFTRLRCFKDGKRFKPPAKKRPVLVAMHDEMIVRHKDIGRHGWTHRRLASQVFKDDGCGRMISDYLLDMLGHLLLNEAETVEVNRMRALKGKPPITWGTLTPTQESGVKLADWGAEDIEKSYNGLTQNVFWRETSPSYPHGRHPLAS
jgi:hypothetical protein